MNVGIDGRLRRRFRRSFHFSDFSGNILQRDVCAKHIVKVAAVVVDGIDGRIPLDAIPAFLLFLRFARHWYGDAYGEGIFGELCRLFRIHMFDENFVGRRVQHGTSADDRRSEMHSVGKIDRIDVGFSAVFGILIVNKFPFVFLFAIFYAYGANAVLVIFVVGVALDFSADGFEERFCPKKIRTT